MGINEKSNALLGLEIQLQEDIKLNYLFENRVEKDLKQFIRFCKKSEWYNLG